VTEYAGAWNTEPVERTLVAIWSLGMNPGFAVADPERIVANIRLDFGICNLTD
jgi:hypothetical protein